MAGALGYRSGSHAKGRWGKHRYRFLAERDLFVCPHGYAPSYATRTPEGKAVYARRKETIERSFADAKELDDSDFFSRAPLSPAQTETPANHEDPQGSVSSLTPGLDCRCKQIATDGGLSGGRGDLRQVCIPG